MKNSSVLLSYLPMGVRPGGARPDHLARRAEEAECGVDFVVGVHETGGVDDGDRRVAAVGDAGTGQSPYGARRIRAGSSPPVPGPVAPATPVAMQRSEQGAAPRRRLSSFMPPAARITCVSLRRFGGAGRALLPSVHRSPTGHQQKSPPSTFGGDVPVPLFLGALAAKRALPQGSRGG